MSRFGRHLARANRPAPAPPPEPVAAYKGRFNVYVCSEGHTTVTKDLDNGTTPMLLVCRATGREGDCDEMAYSRGYPEGDVPAEYLEHYEQRGWDWYRPDAQEMRTLSGAYLHHVAQGGLLLKRHA